MGFKKLGELTDLALRELNSIQQGKKLLVKTGFPMIDDHLKGLLPGDCVVLSGISTVAVECELFTLKNKKNNKIQNIFIITIYQKVHTIVILL